MAKPLAKRTGDFISQGTIDAGIEPVPDALGHHALALAILHKAVFLPPGSVLAIQGAWGRGKTDVLLRVASIVRDPEEHAIPEGTIGDCLWINPWQYGTPDLLTPLVLAIFDRIPIAHRTQDRRLRRLAETLLRAGVNFGMKALGASVSPILSLAADPVDKMIEGLFTAVGVDTHADAIDPDPVAVMGERFSELATLLLTSKGKGDDARLLICIDDLDRCLPNRQVALLEAIRFLISAGAPVTFLIAIDPTLARQAIMTHYRTDAFDPDRYLDKMFDLRVNLPSLGPRMSSLVEKHLTREMRAMGHVMQIGEAMRSLLGDRAVDQYLKDAAGLALSTPDFANPRIVRRIFDRLYLLAVSRATAKLRPLQLNSQHECGQLLAWAAIAERYPAVRAAAQAARSEDKGDTFTERLVFMHRTYVPESGAQQAGEKTQPLADLLASHRLPAVATSPELAATFKFLSPKGEGNWMNVLREIDAALVEAGL
jgi:hypothetical protein